MRLRKDEKGNREIASMFISRRRTRTGRRRRWVEQMK